MDYTIIGVLEILRNKKKPFRVENIANKFERDSHEAYIFESIVPVFCTRIQKNTKMVAD